MISDNILDKLHLNGESGGFNLLRCNYRVRGSGVGYSIAAKQINPGIGTTCELGALDPKNLCFGLWAR